MDKELHKLHLEVGKVCGEEKTCGKKIDYKSEETAEKAASSMMKKGSKDLEPYPCPFCKGWHIGRLMNKEELYSILKNNNRRG